MRRKLSVHLKGNWFFRLTYNLPLEFGVWQIDENTNFTEKSMGFISTPKLPNSTYSGSLSLALQLLVLTSAWIN
jgi:hypothetical protein